MDRDRAAAYWEANAGTWTELSRAGYDVYRDHNNTPGFLAMLPPVDGLSGLDIGCGEGTNTRHLGRLGARMHAIDVAPTFIARARETEAREPLGITYEVADAQALPFADGRFDFATAFMSLMDVPDTRAALAEAYRILRAGGFLQFSIMHPCFAPPHRRVIRDAAGTAQAVEVARYFDHADGEVQHWTFSAAPETVQSRVTPFATPVFHRTLSEWLNGVIETGFTVERMGEPSVDEATALRVPAVADTRITPLFLHVRARKGAPR
jgi:ubiquinone/menaquinone biosynthesis C-methylase UbiE